MKFSGLSRLVVANLWVGNTSALSPTARTWSASGPYPWSLSPPWSLVLPGHVIPFWKAFHEPNNNVGAKYFVVGQKPNLRVTTAGTPKG